MADFYVISTFLNIVPLICSKFIFRIQVKTYPYHLRGNLQQKWLS